MKKRALALCLSVALVAPALLLIQTNSILPKTKAQTTPSVPEFTVTLADHSYDVPTTYSTEPYTGANVTHTGYRVENKIIDITITNQPFVPPNDLVTLAYDVRVKGPFVENWTDLYHYDVDARSSLPRQSTSDNTVISISQHNYPANGTVDFEVEAVIVTGHPIYPGAEFGYWSYVTSDWSNTQTITIPETSAPASPTPSPSPSTITPTPNSILNTYSPIFVTIAIALVAIVFLLAIIDFLLLYPRKPKTVFQSKPPQFSSWIILLI